MVHRIRPVSVPTKSIGGSPCLTTWRATVPVAFLVDSACSRVSIFSNPSIPRAPLSELTTMLNTEPPDPNKIIAPGPIGGRGLIERRGVVAKKTAESELSSPPDMDIAVVPKFVDTTTAFEPSERVATSASDISPCTNPS